MILCAMVLQTNNKRNINLIEGGSDFMKTLSVSPIRNNVVVGLALAVILAASALVFANTSDNSDVFCFFENGVYVTFRNNTWAKLYTVDLKNMSNFDSNVPYIVDFEDGTKTGPINFAIPAGDVRSFKYDKRIRFVYYNLGK